MCPFLLAQSLGFNIFCYAFFLTFNNIFLILSRNYFTGI